MKEILLFVCFLFWKDVVYGQQPAKCEEIKRQADTAFRHGDYRTALTKFRALKICDPSAGKRIDDRILEVYDRIEAQRDTAREAQKRALLAAKAERAARDEAVMQKEVAERQAYIAQLSALSSSLMLLNKENPTLALRFASLAFEKNPTAQNASILHELISDTNNVFYKFKVNMYTNSVAYNSSERELYFANSSFVHVYDANGRYRREIGFKGEIILHTALSPKADYAVTVSGLSDSVWQFTLYNLATQAATTKKLSAVPEIRKLWWSRDGEFILAMGRNSVVIVDTSLNIVYRFGHDNLKAFDVTPKLEGFAISDGNNVLLYDTTDSSPDTIPEPNVYGLAISPYHQRIYTSYYFNNNIKVWEDDSVQQTLVGPNSTVRSLDFSADGESVLASGDDGVSVLWSHNGNMLKVLRTSPGRNFRSLLADDGSAVVTASDQEIDFWDLRINPLGSVDKKYRDILYKKSVALEDISRKSMIVRTGNSFFYLDDERLTPINEKDSAVVFSMSFVGDEGNMLQEYLDSLVLVNPARGLRVCLPGSEKKARFRYAAGPGETFLVWYAQTCYLYSKNGVPIGKKRDLPFIPYNACLAPDGITAYFFGYKMIYRVNMLTGRENRWYTEAFYNESFNKILFSPSGRLMVGFQGAKAVLFDTSWHFLKTYQLGSSINNVLFSPLEDTLIFVTSFGADSRLTHQGIDNSPRIYHLSVSEKLKYNVPGMLGEVVRKKDWREFDECFGYFATRYLSDGSEEDFLQVRPLCLRLPDFTQHTITYYRNLEPRLAMYTTFVTWAREKKKALLEQWASKVVSKLKEEEKLLAPQIRITEADGQKRYFWK